MGRTIAIANQKGGVGKTTTAINLSACLAEAGQRVLTIDFDPQGNATTGLGLEKEQIEDTVYELLLGDCTLKDCLMRDVQENLDVLPSDSNLAGAEIELLDVENKESVLNGYLETIRDQYDFIIIDCPPSLGMMPINALSAADSVLIPVQAQYFSMRGLLQLIRTIDKVQRRQNPRLKIEGIVLTLVDNRTNLSRDVSAMLRDAYGANVHIFKTEIPMCVRAAESPSFGKSIFDYDPRGKATLAYEQLAREVLTLGRKKELGRGGFAPTR